ncbi:MAG: hypothetical protein AVDCRST_MAG13-957 [uncultured Solirubrobacteraceae bacterium]|uniref:Methyltransferase domain-containing protein n=1 Tax=uncultured Solirubrobacteraceae bacterium TaxID=1162706 RepID=A0A6J4RS16_9ACTN|nr:MAG: hypothetical protein AVDCRST_MAG13-957 [uncultured Solirubrobacteraceae bacterium]
MSVAYWRARAREHGPRAVISLDHPADADLGAVTAGHRGALLPLLAALLRGGEGLVCDLGCGTGRFTADLAELAGGRAIGVDPVPELLALALPGPRVDFRLLGDDGRIPLDEDEAGVVFTSLVLGGLVAPGALAATAAEVRRVLAPGGLLFLAESVSAGPGPPHWRPRTAQDYRAAFPWAALEEVASFDDAGDHVAVLAGRAGA